MNMEHLFKFFNMAVVPAWILLVFFPKHNITKKLVLSFIYPIVLAVFYTIFIVWGSIENLNLSGSGIYSLEALRITFTNDMVLLAAWIHYLVFDMIVGAWIVKNTTASMSRIVVSICLFITLMFGPAGFLGFMGYRYFHKEEI